MDHRSMLDSTSSDEVLCAKAASGDRVAEEILVMRYNRLVRICARPFFLVGGDSEDLIQEGMLGLLFAIRSFQVEKAASFHTFAEICIKSRLISAVRSASSGKHSPLIAIFHSKPPLLPISLLLWTLACHRRTLRMYLSAGKSCRSLWTKRKINCPVSKRTSWATTWKVFPIKRSQAQVKRSPKSVDNAVQRIRRKLAQHFSFGEFSKS